MMLPKIKKDSTVMEFVIIAVLGLVMLAVACAPLVFIGWCIIKLMQHFGII